MRPLPSLFTLLLLLLGLILLVTFIQLGVITIVLDKLGLSPGSAALLLLVFLVGSLINVPLFSVEAEAPPAPPPVPLPYRGLLPPPRRPFQGRTVIAINVGGGLAPVLFSLFLLHHAPLPAATVITGITIVGGVSYAFSRPVPGVGIGMPVLIAPVTAALTALLLAPEASAPLAYISGTLGVLIGADLLRLKDIRRMGTPVASIGGAGTFDGIFITGIVAVLLA